MAKQYKILSTEDIAFIKRQKLFFIASASSAEVNLSPKGYESIYVKDAQTLYMADYPGSGNRTARDIKEGGSVTLLFQAFEGEAKILRLFCEGQIIQKHEEGFEEPFSHFSIKRSILRQIFKFHITSLESSCGMSIPFMRYEKDREELKTWATQMAEDGDLKAYIAAHEVPKKI